MKRTILMILILCTVFFITTSSCFAQVIYGCVKNGVLTIMTGPGQCRQNDTPVSWNVTGPQGLQGVQGLQGLPGVQGPEGPAGASTGTAFLGTKALTEPIVKRQYNVPWTTVVTADLPAGTYLLSGDGVVNRNRTTLPGYGSALQVYCRLRGGDLAVDDRFTLFNNGATLDTAPVSLGGRVILPVAGPVTIECAHDDFFDTVVSGVGFELYAQGVIMQVNP